MTDNDPWVTPYLHVRKQSMEVIPLHALVAIDPCFADKIVSPVEVYRCDSSFRNLMRAQHTDMFPVVVESDWSPSGQEKVMKLSTVSLDPRRMFCRGRRCRNPRNVLPRAFLPWKYSHVIESRMSRISRFMCTRFAVLSMSCKQTLFPSWINCLRRRARGRYCHVASRCTSWRRAMTKASGSVYLRRVYDRYWGLATAEENHMSWRPLFSPFATTAGEWKLDIYSPVFFGSLVDLFSLPRWTNWRIGCKHVADNHDSPPNYAAQSDEGLLDYLCSLLGVRKI